MRKKLWFACFTALLFLALTAIITTGGRAAAGSHTLVLDPGHGGLDGGAVSADGTKESELNLEVALRVRELTLLCGVPTILTRASETIDYPDTERTTHGKKVWDQNRRLAIVEETDAPVFLSIHQNFYPDPRPRGSQVLYGGFVLSKALGTVTHDNLIACLCPGNRRVAAPAPSSIFLMRELRCPAILVECGFLSNREEAQQLKDADYQTKLALVLAGSYLQFQSRYL